MSVEGRYFTWTIVAGEDLDDLNPGSGELYKAVALDDGKIAQNGIEPLLLPSWCRSSFASGAE